MRLCFALVLIVCACDPQVGVYFTQTVAPQPPRACVTRALRASQVVDSIRPDPFGGSYDVRLVDSLRKQLRPNDLVVSLARMGFDSTHLSINFRMAGTTFDVTSN